jgi:hypothetical protein
MKNSVSSVDFAPLAVDHAGDELWMAATGARGARARSDDAGNDTPEHHADEV